MSLYVSVCLVTYRLRTANSLNLWIPFGGNEYSDLELYASITSDLNKVRRIRRCVYLNLLDRKLF